MKCVHQRSGLERLTHAALQYSLGSLGHPRQVLAFARSWLRFPIEYAAAKVVDATPAVSFAELFPERATPTDLTPPGRLDRHDWNVRLDEKLYIGLGIQAVGARRIFEIGTFDGATTRYMAEAAGPEAHVFTLDLPPVEFDRTQRPADFSGTRVGFKFHGTREELRITQLLGDSLEFDYSPYLQSCDFVFVDAAHDYEHGLRDSQNALRLVRPGGVILWHDYTAYWPGLVHAIREATRGCGLARLAGTSLAIVRTDQ